MSSSNGLLQLACDQIKRQNRLFDMKLHSKIPSQHAGLFVAMMWSCIQRFQHLLITLINLKHLCKCETACHNMAFAMASWPFCIKSSYGSKAVKAIAAVFVCWGDLSPGESNDRCGGMGVCLGNCWAIFTQIISNVMKCIQMLADWDRKWSNQISPGKYDEICIKELGVPARSAR